jgi:tryprostatin B 6-hydroxylase
MTIIDVKALPDTDSISIVIYRLFLHPLKDYPGPVLARVSKWYCFYKSSQGRSYQIQPRYHEKYGDVVRVGPNELSFVDPEAVKWIHGSQANKVPKGPSYEARLWADGISLGDETDLMKHKVRRKFWDRGLAIKAITSYEPRIVRIINVLKSKFDKYAGKTRNLPPDRPRCERSTE